MSVRILTMAALLTSVALSQAVAQGKTSFTGSWKVNVEKSDPMGGGGGGGGGMGAGGGMASAVTTITQTDAKLTIEVKSGDNPARTTVYNLDGTESTNTTQRGESKSKAHWEGPALVIETTRTFNGPNGAVTNTSTDTRTLSADGKMMTVVTNGTNMQGEKTTTKRVYDKQ